LLLQAMHEICVVCWPTNKSVIGEFVCFRAEYQACFAFVYVGVTFGS
jgi:hypothetical protein